MTHLLLGVLGTDARDRVLEVVHEHLVHRGVGVDVDEITVRRWLLFVQTQTH